MITKNLSILPKKNGRDFHNFYILTANNVNIIVKKIFLKLILNLIITKKIKL